MSLSLSTGEIIAIVDLVITGGIAYLALRFTVKPRISVDFLGENSTGRKQFQPGEKVRLRYKVNNVGWPFLGKPAARNLRLFVNFDSAFGPSRIHFGSTLERTDDQVRRGVGGSKYLIADGIQLFYREPGEAVDIDTVVPSSPGCYKCWIAAESNSGDHGVETFYLCVEPLQTGGDSTLN